MMLLFWRLSPAGHGYGVGMLRLCCGCVKLNGSGMRKSAARSLASQVDALPPFRKLHYLPWLALGIPESTQLMSSATAAVLQSAGLAAQDRWCRLVAVLLRVQLYSRERASPRTDIVAV